MDYSDQFEKAKSIWDSLTPEQRESFKDKLGEEVGEINIKLDSREAVTLAGILVDRVSLHNREVRKLVWEGIAIAEHHARTGGTDVTTAIAILIKEVDDIRISMKGGKPSPGFIAPLLACILDGVDKLRQKKDSDPELLAMEKQVKDSMKDKEL